MIRLLSRKSGKQHEQRNVFLQFLALIVLQWWNFHDRKSQFQKEDRIATCVNILPAIYCTYIRNSFIHNKNESSQNYEYVTSHSCYLKGKYVASQQEGVPWDISLSPSLPSYFSPSRGRQGGPPPSLLRPWHIKTPEEGCCPLPRTLLLWLGRMTPSIRDKIVWWYQ